MMNINTYLASQHAANKAPFAKRIFCADGFSLSVQAGRSLYCVPREDVGPWSSVEVGFPSQREEALMPYIDMPEADPTQTVYGYAPVEVVEALIAEHGGWA